MGMEFSGHPLSGGGRSFAIAASSFNEAVVGNLVRAAQHTLLHAGVREDDIDVAWCPGAVELPLLSSALAKTGRYDAVVAVGCVIRGGTPHFDYVSQVASAGIGQTALQTGVPISFGVLTCDTLEQALDRSCPEYSADGAQRTVAEAAKEGVSGLRVGDAGCNKGVEAAEAAVEMASVLCAIAEVGGKGHG
jgi:6,7-dimethyl-8-ribityllumazine synthase